MNGNDYDRRIHLSFSRLTSAFLFRAQLGEHTQVLHQQTLVPVDLHLGQRASYLRFDLERHQLFNRRLHPPQHALSQRHVGRDERVLLQQLLSDVESIVEGLQRCV